VKPVHVRVKNKIYKFLLGSDGFWFADTYSKDDAEALFDYVNNESGLPSTVVPFTQNEKEVWRLKLLIPYALLRIDQWEKKLFA
jgi:hypothetical protein